MAINHLRVLGAHPPSNTQHHQPWYSARTAPARFWPCVAADHLPCRPLPWRRFQADVSCKEWIFRVLTYIWNYLDLPPSPRMQSLPPGLFIYLFGKGSSKQLQLKKHDCSLSGRETQHKSLFCEYDVCSRRVYDQTCGVSLQYLLSNLCYVKSMIWGAWGSRYK